MQKGSIKLTNDMNEKSSNELFKKLGFKIIKIWTTHDARKDRKDEKWLNC